MVAATSRTGTTSVVCAGTEADVTGASDEEEAGVVDEQAARREDVTSAVALRKMGSFIFPDYVCFVCSPVSHTVSSPPDMRQSLRALGQRVDSTNGFALC